MTRLEQLGARLSQLADAIGKFDLDLVAANEAEGIIKSRAFADGGGYATDGSALPQYSDAYKKSKVFRKAGKTGSRWNLQLHDDLFNNTMVVTRGKDVYVAIVGPSETVKADGLEDHLGKPIFDLSDNERKEVIETTAKVFNRDLKKAINRIFK